MQVHLYATFRLIAKVNSFSLDLPDGTNVAGAVQAIVSAHPVLGPHWLDEAGELYPHVHVFLNGNDAAALPGGLNTLVGPDDSLDFFPPVAGGAGE